MYRKRLLIGTILALATLILFSFSKSLTSLRSPETLQALKDYQKGAWVKYQIKRFQKKGAGLKKIWGSDLKIISLGRATTLGTRKLTWLELVANEGKDYQKVIRVLIDEQGELVQERLVVKHGVLPAAEIDLNLWAIKTKLNKEWLFEDFTSQLLILPIGRLHKSETKTTVEDLSLTINKKKSFLECEKYKVTGLSSNQIEKRWYASDLPFSGLVKLLAIESSEQDEYHTQIILTGYGTNGTSMIREVPMSLDFKER